MNKSLTLVILVCVRVINLHDKKINKISDVCGSKNNYLKSYKCQSHIDNKYKMLFFYVGPVL